MFDGSLPGIRDLTALDDATLYTLVRAEDKLDVVAHLSEAVPRLVTLRKSLTKLETTGYVPSAIAVNPTDFEAVELALATTTAPRTHELAVRCCGPQVVGHTSGGDQRRRRRCGVNARAGCSRIDDR